MGTDNRGMKAGEGEGRLEKISGRKRGHVEYFQQ